MKYQIHMHRRTVKTVDVIAATPHAAILEARKSNPEFNAESVWKMIKDPEDPGDASKDIPGMPFEIESYCETCDNPILTGDHHFDWGGEDAIKTCSACGGAGENHQPSIV